MAHANQCLRGWIEVCAWTVELCGHTNQEFVQGAMAAAQTTQAAVAPPACDLETNSFDDTSSTECSIVATPVKAKDLNCRTMSMPKK